LQDIRAEQFFLDKLKKIISSKEKDEEIENVLENIISSGKSSLKKASMIVKNLVPPEVEMGDFMLNLNDLVHNFQNTREIQCSFYTNSNVLLKKLDIEQKIHIYRIIQEAMTNAAKHAKPSEIKVAVREDLKKNLINFFITDDGCGFISKTTKDINIENSTSLGLKGMESRAIILNGTLDIHSDEETGTHIKLVVPVEANNKD
jgi:signal transduction histidine kinase